MKNLKPVFLSFKQKAADYVLHKEVALMMLFAASPTLNSFASKSLTGGDSWNSSTQLNNGSGVVWPWTAFLNSLVKELTGPLALTLGVAAIAIAALGMFMGNHGAGMQKMLTLIFAVGIILAAPTFVNWLASSSSGLTILVGM